jgi:uncharacterized membrane protein YagU involved in acid resistance
MKKRQRPLLLDIAIGTVAGVAATFVMDEVTTFLYEKEDRDTREREDKARGGKSAYQVVAEKGADAIGREITEEQAKKLGTGIHWATGITTGTLYGVLRNRFPRLGIGTGPLYGTLVWAVIDEGATLALGLTPGPKSFPWQTHARGLAGHVVLGTIIETAFDAIDLATKR